MHATPRENLQQKIVDALAASHERCVTASTSIASGDTHVDESRQAIARSRGAFGSGCRRDAACLTPFGRSSIRLPWRTAMAQEFKPGEIVATILHLHDHPRSRACRHAARGDGD